MTILYSAARKKPEPAKWLRNAAAHASIAEMRYPLCLADPPEAHLRARQCAAKRAVSDAAKAIGDLRALQRSLCLEDYK